MLLAMQPGLLAFDLDGTIVAVDAKGDGHALVPGLPQELMHWRAAGWQVAVVTARSVTPDFIAPLQADAVTRLYGAHIVVNGLEVCRHVLPAQVVQQAMRVLTAHDLSFDVGKTLVTGVDPLRGWWNGPHNPGFAAEYHDVQDVLRVYHGQNDAQRVNEVQAAWEGIPGTQVIREHAQVVALVAAEADKGGALRRIASEFHIPLHRVLALGDGNSDAAMLRAAGTFMRVGHNPVLASAAHHLAKPEDVPRALAALRAGW